MKDIREIREQLDLLDGKLAELFAQRFKLAEEVARYKISTGKKVLDKEREEQKLADINGLVAEEGYRYFIEDLFIRIMDFSKKIQYRVMELEVPFENDFIVVDKIDKSNVKVVYQGVPGAYSHEAMFKVFGQSVNNRNVETFRDAMEALREGAADYAVLPIENSSAGIVSEMYDLLVEFENYIIEETSIKVNHALLGLPHANIEDIKKIFSHPQGLMQCAEFLDAHKDWEKIAQQNTAVSAIKVSEDGDVSQAAIASTVAAKLYGLKILQENINFADKNTTRFIVVSSKKTYRKDANKIMVGFELPHESGSLYKLLSHIIHNKLNMTKIESRPIPDKPWEYRFFVEFEGNLQNTEVMNALRGIKEEAISFRLLGNY